MDDIKNECISESGNVDSEHAAMSKLTELKDTPLRDKVTKDDYNETPQNENTEEADLENLRMQLWTSNYIIVRNIINQLDWRDQLRCELVCRLWRDAVKSLQRENLRSYDFAVQAGARSATRVKLRVSHLPVQTRPMFAVGFYNAAAVDHRFRCKEFSPAPCDPVCNNKHSIIEAVHAMMLSKRSCLLAVYGCRLIYMPRPTSRTFQYTIHGMLKPSVPFLGGLYLPQIPNVNYHTIQYRTKRTVQEDVYNVVDVICATDIIKGVIVFVEDQFLLIEDENLGFLNYFKSKQPNIPYALGGCVVELAGKGTMIEGDVTVTMGVFSVPKEPKPVPGPPCHFNIYSLIIDSTVYKKAAIQNVIQTFAENISELQFSTALKLSCIGRERTHTIEQELFRASFPRTTLLGCYGNGEIGYSHPDIRPQPTKRAKRLSDGEPEFTYSYSTVFVYFTWGKPRTRGEEAHHSAQ